MPPLTIRLLGKFRVQRDGIAVTGLDGRKVQECFSYLLLRREHPHQRESLATLLWPSCSTAQSKSYLRKALWQLQAAVNPTNGPTPPVLRVDADTVQLNTDAEIWLDIAILERAFSHVKGKRGRELDPAGVELLHQAAALYQGNLLEGWFDDWCFYERERYQQMYLMLLDKLMGYSEAHRLYDEGITYGMQILRYEQANERTHQRLMRLYHLAGDRTAALRQYERCRAALQRELNVAPDEQTMRLYERLRANRLDDLPPRRDSIAGMAEPASASQQAIVSRLHHFQAILLEAQRQIQEELQAVEAALRSQH